MSAVEQYQDFLMQSIRNAFISQREAIEQAAQQMYTCIISGHFVYLFGTGHAHILAEELFYRAGGLAAMVPILDEKLMLHISASTSTQLERKAGYAEELLQKYPVGKGDMLFVFSNSGINAAPVEMARIARQRGAFVVALTNVRHSRSCEPRNAMNTRLMNEADIVLDNCGAIGDAALQIGEHYRVGATSTSVGAALLHAIECRCVEIAVERNMSIDVFSSSNVKGGDDANEVVLKKYRPMIPML